MVACQQFSSTQISDRLRSLKRFIIGFEREFEAHHGRKPQREDKLPIIAELREYKRLKTQLAQLPPAVLPPDPEPQDTPHELLSNNSGTPSSAAPAAAPQPAPPAPLILPAAPVTHVPVAAPSQAASANYSMSVSIYEPHDPLAASMNETLPAFVFETALQWATEQLTKWRIQHKIPPELEVWMLADTTSD